MQDLAQERCFRHRQREAVARCPDCGRFFCRECVTEHQDRLLCRACLEKQIGPKHSRKAKAAVLLRLVQFFCGTLGIWLVFYLLGRVLLSIPSDFHEGTVWSKGWWGG